MVSREFIIVPARDPSALSLCRDDIIVVIGFSLLFIVFCFNHFIICENLWAIYGNLCFN